MAEPNKPTSADTPNQVIYQDDQNFDIDIDQLYQDWIVKIDSIRSSSSIQNNSKILSSLGKNSVITVNNKTKMENTVQESRCHAFYRFIGLPVLGEGGAQFYNPGFDIIKDPSRDLTLAKKQSIATKPVNADFNTLSDARENQALDALKVFSNPLNIESGALALSSGGTQKLRSFISPLDKDPTPLGAKKEDQTYDVNAIARVGTRDVPLTEFKDRNGVSPKSGLLTKRSHIIKPFIVDPRIDFTVNPQSRLMAVPFVPNDDESYLIVNGTEKVERPVLEKIIRDRLAEPNIANAGTNANNIKEYIDSVPSIKDADLIKLVSTNDIYKQTDSAKFINNINTIRAMMIKLVDAENLVRKAQGFYYWVPAPSTAGPEGGSTVQDIFISLATSTTLQTALDREIVISAIKSITSNKNSEAAQQLKFPVPTTDFSSSTTQGLGDNNAEDNETLSATRTRILKVASTALQTIEVIMGEFSGLGLCDIVALICALNIMDKSKLLGLLDLDAYNRMLKTFGNASAAGFPRNGSVVECLTELTERVKDYYNLMDQVYKDIKLRHPVT